MWDTDKKVAPILWKSNAQFSLVISFCCRDKFMLALKKKNNTKSCNNITSDNDWFVL